MPDSMDTSIKKGRAAERRAFLRFLETQGIQVTKSLGQNFLFEETLLDELAELASVSERDLVFELGAGTGSLTAALLRRCTEGHVISCEIDLHLEKLLSERFADENRLSLIFADALKLDFSAIVEDKRMSMNRSEHPLRIAANLPYYITTELICKCLCSLTEAESMAFMVQEEARERILAQHTEAKAYGPMAVLINTYGKTKLLKRVPRQAFIPEPHVDSVFIVIQKTHDDSDALRTYLQKNMSEFFRFLNTAFAQRRKTLLNNLKTLGPEKEFSIKRKLAVLGYAENVRAEAMFWKDLGAIFALDIFP